MNLKKISKEEYVKLMISFVDEDAVKETWEDFKEKFKTDTGRNPEFWTDFMELDDADLSDLQIFASLDKNFETFVVNDPTILNEEVSEKINKKTSGKIPDHIQIDIEGETGCLDGNTYVEIPRNLKKYPKGIKIKNLVGKKDFFVYSLNTESGNLELKKVKRVWKTGIKQTYEITTITGRKLIATDNHPFLVNKYSDKKITSSKFSNFKIIGREYKEVKDLVVGDKLIIFRRTNEHYCRIKTNFNSGVKKSKEEHRFITEYLYGIDRTSCVHHIDRNTKNNSLDNLMIQSYYQHQKFHTLQRKWYGSKLWIKKGHPKGNKGKKLIIKKENKTIPQNKIPNFNFINLEFSKKVSYSVKKGWIKFKKNKKKYDLWLEKTKNYCSCFEKIITIKKLNKREVYDMEVEDNHNFFANGICVHNCGKSTFMRAIALEFFPNFCCDDIFFMKKELMEYVSTHSETAYKSCKVLDEDVVSRGVGSIRVDEDLSQLFESCRKAELSYIGCHAIRKHENQTVFYRFFVFAKNSRRRITCAGVYRKNVCIGFLLWRIPYSKKFFELEYDYEKKKDEFIEKTLRNENIETIDIKKCALQVLADPECVMLRKGEKLNKKILKLKTYELFNHYTIGEQDLICQKAFIIMLAEELGEDPDTPADPEILKQGEK